jgi:hypothetical protein
LDKSLWETVRDHLQNIQARLDAGIPVEGYAANLYQKSPDHLGIVLNIELQERLNKLTESSGYSFDFIVYGSPTGGPPELVALISTITQSHPLERLTHRFIKRLSYRLGFMQKSANSAIPVNSQLDHTPSAAIDCPLRTLCVELDKESARIYQPAIQQAEDAWTYLDSIPEQEQASLAIGLRKLFPKTPIIQEGVPIDTLFDISWRQELLTTAREMSLRS